jgi:hypothetical protein
VNKLVDPAGDLSTSTDAELELVRLAEAILKLNSGRQCMPPHEESPVLGLLARLVETGIGLGGLPTLPPSRPFRLILRLVERDSVPELVPRRRTARELPPDILSLIEAALSMVDQGSSDPVP